MKYGNKFFLGSVIAFLILAPLFLWAFYLPLPERLNGIHQVFLSLGQIFALVGMMAFSLSLILSLRTGFLDRIKLVIPQIHHFLGSLALICLLYHPLLLGLNYALYDNQIGAKFFWFGDSVSNNFGIVALYLMIAVFLFIYFIKVSRFLWIWSHRLLLPIYIVGLIHLLKAGSDIGRLAVLKYYILFFAFVAIISSFVQVAASLAKPKVISRPQEFSGTGEAK